MVMLAFMFANSVAAIFLTWTPTFLVEKFDFKLTSAGLSGSVFIQLASACSVPFAGWAADVVARRFPGGRMLIQAVALVGGAFFVFFVGSTTQVSTLLAAMTLFGLCKGCYDANIWAGLYDVVPPRARATAVGIMNTVGWGGGAMAPWAFGSFAKRGGGTEIENMSHAISFGGAIYLAAAAILFGAVIFRARRDIPLTQTG